MALERDRVITHCAPWRGGGILWSAAGALALVLAAAPAEQAAAANIACVNADEIPDSWSNPFGSDEGTNWENDPEAPEGEDNPASNNALACGEAAEARGRRATAYGANAKALGDLTAAVSGEAINTGSTALGVDSRAGINVGNTPGNEGGRGAMVAAVSALQDRLRAVRNAGQADATAPDAAEQQRILTTYLQTGTITFADMRAMAAALLDSGPFAGTLGELDIDVQVPDPEDPDPTNVVTEIDFYSDSGTGSPDLQVTGLNGNSYLNTEQGNNYRADRGTAVGQGAAATGRNLRPDGTRYDPDIPGATSVGQGSTAAGNASTVIGASAGAIGANSVAIGARALALHENSVAIGANAVTTEDNQVVLGNSGTQTFNMPGLTFDTQLPPDTEVRPVIVGEDGTLSVSEDRGIQRTALAGLAARTEEMDLDIKESMALAMAVGGARRIPGKDINVSFNAGTFQDESAASISGSALIDEVILSGGVGYGFRRGQIGGRIGVSVGW